MELRSLKCQVAFLESAQGDESTTFYHNNYVVIPKHMQVCLCAYVCMLAYLLRRRPFGINES